ncbi:MAG TPA: NAD(P)-dependent oxidoreductase, partial [Sideroxyarcus sp.]|nr:NAD(P)-dependent oxidoreductase [Sideroxyarcus sp.]
MDFLPVFHNVKGKLCLVVGGGEVAKRKAGVLLEAGAKVRVVAPEIEPGLAKQKGVEPVVARFEA